MKLFCSYCDKDVEFIPRPLRRLDRSAAYCSLCGRYIKWLSNQELERMDIIRRYEAPESTRPHVEFYSPSGNFPTHVDGAVGWDIPLRPNTIQTVQHSTYKRLHTDISVVMNATGYYGRIVSRSSTFKRHQLLVIEGTIDPDYTGELLIQVYNVDEFDVKFLGGECIAQLIFTPYLDVTTQMHQITPPAAPLGARGTKGWGSSDG